MKNKASKTLSYSVFYEQAPEGGFVAFVPLLPGCHTQGETLEETERNVRKRLHNILKGCWLTVTRFQKRGDLFKEG
jgi:predicted RNase H-like HicB family nuclease